MFWIFLSLAIVDVAVLIGAGFTGFANRFENYSQQTHIAAGLIAAVYTVFVHSLVFIYFMGSSKSINEAVLRNNLDPKFLAVTPQLRKRAFPIAWAVCSLAVAAAILGGGVWSGFIPKWVHLSLGILTMATTLFAIPRECRAIWENGKLVEEVRTEILARKSDEPEQPVEEYLGLIPLGKGLIISGFSVWGIFFYMKWIMKENVSPFPWFLLASILAIGLGWFLMQQEKAVLKKTSEQELETTSNRD